MAGGKLTARQKMINMMYLVLTALLALNVSKEIIKAFNLIENSLDNSTTNIVEKNKLIANAIKKQADDNNATAKKAAFYANKVSEIANKFYAEIDKHKQELEKRTGDGKDPKTGRKSEPEAVLVKGGKPELAQGDNIEVHAHYFILEKKGKEIEDLINNANTQLLDVLKQAANDPELGKNENAKAFIMGKVKTIGDKSSLVAKAQVNSDGKTQDWTSMFLEHSPLAGVMAILSKYQNDCRTVESECLQTLAEAISATDYKFDSIKAIVSAKSGAILTGETYEADIILAAYSTKSNMVVTVNGSPIEVKDGVGKYKVPAGGVGQRKFKVGITIPGENKLIEGEGEYNVFEPMASISAEKLNVFYVGLENPISISVAGVNPANVTVSASEGNLVKTGPGNYNVLIPVRKGNESVVSVSAKLNDGRVQSMGSKKFKIRNVPRPSFRAGTLSFDKPVPLAALNVQSVATALLDGFVYEGVKYSIVSYTFIGIGRTGPKKINVTGASLGPIKGILSGMRSGEFVMFTDIRAQGPGGTVYLDNASGTLQ